VVGKIEMQDYRNLEVWQRAMDYVAEIYRFSSAFPEGERFNMASQIRRAATSIPLNISEGAGCESKREFTKFLVYAYRSSNEVITCLELANRLGLCHDNGRAQELIDEGNSPCKMLYSFLRKLKTTNPEPITRNPKPITKNHERYIS
jgi:four helix bundle protein